MARPRLCVETLRVRGRGTVGDPDRFARVLVSELARQLTRAQAGARIDRIRVRDIAESTSAPALAARVADAILARLRR